MFRNSGGGFSSGPRNSYGQGYGYGGGSRPSFFFIPSFGWGWGGGGMGFGGGFGSLLVLGLVGVRGFLAGPHGPAQPASWSRRGLGLESGQRQRSRHVRPRLRLSDASRAGTIGARSSGSVGQLRGRRGHQHRGWSCLPAAADGAGAVARKGFHPGRLCRRQRSHVPDQCRNQHERRGSRRAVAFPGRTGPRRRRSRPSVGRRGRRGQGSAGIRGGHPGGGHPGAAWRLEANQRSRGTWRLICASLVEYPGRDCWGWRSYGPPRIPTIL